MAYEAPEVLNAINYATEGEKAINDLIWYLSANYPKISLDAIASYLGIAKDCFKAIKEMEP